MLLAARRIPLDPERPHTVLFAPELEHDLVERDDFMELIDEVERALSQNLEDLPGKRVGKVAGSDRPTLHKYRPHTDNQHPVPVRHPPWSADRADVLPAPERLPG